MILGDLRFRLALPPPLSFPASPDPPKHDADPARARRGEGWIELTPSKAPPDPPAETYHPVLPRAPSETAAQAGAPPESRRSAWLEFAVLALAGVAAFMAWYLSRLADQNRRLESALTGERDARMAQVAKLSSSLPKASPGADGAPGAEGSDGGVGTQAELRAEVERLRADLRGQLADALRSRQQLEQFGKTLDLVRSAVDEQARGWSDVQRRVTLLEAADDASKSAPTASGPALVEVGKAAEAALSAAQLAASESARRDSELEQRHAAVAARLAAAERLDADLTQRLTQLEAERGAATEANKVAGSALEESSRTASAALTAARETAERSDRRAGELEQRLSAVESRASQNPPPVQPAQVEALARQLDLARQELQDARVRLVAVETRAAGTAEAAKQTELAALTQAIEGQLSLLRADLATARQQLESLQESVASTASPASQSQPAREQPDPTALQAVELARAAVRTAERAEQAATTTGDVGRAERERIEATHTAQAQSLDKLAAELAAVQLARGVERGAVEALGERIDGLNQGLEALRAELEQARQADAAESRLQHSVEELRSELQRLGVRLEEMSLASAKAQPEPALAATATPAQEPPAPTGGSGAVAVATPPIDGGAPPRSAAASPDPAAAREALEAILRDLPAGAIAYREHAERFGWGDGALVLQQVARTAEQTLVQSGALSSSNLGPADFVDDWRSVLSRWTELERQSAAWTTLEQLAEARRWYLSEGHVPDLGSEPKPPVLSQSAPHQDWRAKLALQRLMAEQSVGWAERFGKRRLWRDGHASTDKVVWFQEQLTSRLSSGEFAHWVLERVPYAEGEVAPGRSQRLEFSLDRATLTIGGRRALELRDPSSRCEVALWSGPAPADPPALSGFPSPVHLQAFRDAMAADPQPCLVVSEGGARRWFTCAQGLVREEVGGIVRELVHVVP
jgi:hypothetical protein